MSKLTYSPTKTLRLNNVLIYRMLMNDENFNLQVAIEQMQNYIRVKGATQIGPLIQHTEVKTTEDGTPDISIYFMLQANNFIHNVEAPYTMEPVVKASDCMYCRFTGPEDKLKIAYDKIGVEAYEADVELDGSSYTVFVSNDVAEGTMVADVFTPRKSV